MGHLGFPWTQSAQEFQAISSLVPVLWLTQQSSHTMQLLYYNYTGENYTFIGLSEPSKNVTTWTDHTTTGW